MSRTIFKKLVSAATAVICFTFAVNAQAPWATGIHRVGDIIVAKAPNPDNPSDVPHFNTIQAAVNNAQPGQIIQIMDTSVYAEQVTIDGRGELSPWYHWLQRNASTHIGVDTISAQGKNNISIVYIPRGGWGAAGALGRSAGRPTIRYQDTYNNRPANMADADNGCDLPSECLTVCNAIHGTGSPLCSMVSDAGGGSSNFQNNGALRILHAQNIVIDGIRIDGGGVWTRGASIWGGVQFYGNAAVAVNGSGSAAIRNSEIFGATSGIYVNDRNVGGVFANRTPDDMLAPTPLSRFGRMGNHIFEYNRIHRNLRGVFIESGWDLGLYIRHNLIFDNNSLAGPNAVVGTEGNRAGGIYFRDHIFSPVAIHNNTFFNNNANINGGWQIGAPHLIYNNIFGAPRISNHHEITGLHRNRLHNSVFSASMLQVQGGQQAYLLWMPYSTNDHGRPPSWPSELRVTSLFDGPNDNEVSEAVLNAAYAQCIEQSGGAYFTLPGSVSIADMGYYNSLISPPAASPNSGIIYPAQLSASNTFTVETVGGDVVGPFPCRIFISNYADTWDNPDDVGYPAGNLTVLPGASLGVLPPANNNRFLQMDGHTQAGMPVLFQSTTPTNANFLVPVWNNEHVQEFVREAGWGAVNNANTNGALDLGARQFATAERPQFNAHIVPTNVVMLDTGTLTATVNYRLDVTDQRGRRVNMENPTITHLRWVEPLPHMRGVFPENGSSMIVGAPAHMNILEQVTTATVNPNANNMFTFQVPRIPGTLPTRDSVGAFLEIVISGTVNGQPVSSNVGFLPYRNISNSIDICVLDVGAPNNSTNCLTEVIAGEPYEVRIRPLISQNNEVLPFTYTLPHVDFWLQFGGNLWCADNQPTANGEGPNDHARMCPQPNDLAGNFRQGIVGDQERTYIVGDQNVVHGAKYRVFFSQAGDERIFVTGISHMLDNSFVGIQDIRVLPAAPSQITFIDPLPLRTREVTPGACAGVGSNGANNMPLPDGCLSIANMNIDGAHNVVVEVQDRFGNATNQEVTVTIASDNTEVGDAGARGNWETSKTAATNSTWGDLNMGRAFFEAHVTGGELTQYFDLTATATFDGNTFSDIARLQLGTNVSILEIDREVGQIEEVVIVAPVERSSLSFVVGPNPVDRDNGLLRFFVNAELTSNSTSTANYISGTLTIFDNSGNIVRRIDVLDVPDVLDNRRTIAEWDLRDMRGRVVSEGTYLVRGALTINGRRERVSALIGVK